MATPIVKTWLEFLVLGGGTACREMQEYLDANHPTLDESTNVDTLTFMEEMRTANLIPFTYPTICRGMTQAQRAELLEWVLGHMKSNLPDPWAKKAAVESAIDDLIDYMNAPTTAKKNALQAIASATSFDYDDPKDKFVIQPVKGIINMVLSGEADHRDLTNFIKELMRNLERNKGIPRDAMLNALFDQMQVILGIVDP